MGLVERRELRSNPLLRSETMQATHPPCCWGRLIVPDPKNLRGCKGGDWGPELDLDLKDHSSVRGKTSETSQT